MRIFLGLFSMPLINICSKGDCELKDIQNFLVVINDNNVRLEVGDAQVDRDCATFQKVTICGVDSIVKNKSSIIKRIST